MLNQYVQFMIQDLITKTQSLKKELTIWVFLILDHQIIVKNSFVMISLMPILCVMNGFVMENKEQDIQMDNVIKEHVYITLPLKILIHGLEALAQNSFARSLLTDLIVQLLMVKYYQIQSHFHNVMI